MSHMLETVQYCNDSVPNEVQYFTKFNLGFLVGACFKCVFWYSLAQFARLKFSHLIVALRNAASE